MRMAATFCNLNPGSGLKKLNECLLHQSYMTRYYLDSKRSSYFLCNGRKLLHSTYRRQLEVRKGHQSQWVYLVSKSDYSGTTNEEEKEDGVSRATLIWRAVKLPMYSVALVPLTVGSAAAYFQTGICSARRFFVLLASSVLVITWLNLRTHIYGMYDIFLQPKLIHHNDVYDFDTGADKNKKESVVNLVGIRTGTLVAAYSLLALGFVGLTWVSMEAGSIRSIMLLACSIICGYIYQSPPFRLSYQGLGEPLCFAAFGPFASTAFYLLQGSTRKMNHLPISGTILSASILVGITTTLILFCSHFHQVEGDKAVGKMSPLVRLGTRRGSKAVKVTVITLYVLAFALGLINALPFTSILLCAFTLPMGKVFVTYVEDNHKDNQKIFMAKYYCVRFHALFGAALAAGLVVARMMGERYVPRLILF
ncbi:2-carboxy-1,4-naphthoquinone phytyltransferase, chloroplastic isoform X2 [Carya illinoinensis]|uniref:2-carboxy-1,4-naphthoquinone phytyltransferase, chloroplastic isoform X2 n=1 Tax=Carya illinoinensis TaxID=32201 RepID=UPI001C7281A2|nr:2-carboxy-1,4-naphthoquinone phytyltransferase, chloroplastic isoform X2 [Carya illinoinensis]